MTEARPGCAPGRDRGYPAAMQSPEQLAWFRSLSPGERLRLTLELCEYADAFLERLTKEDREKRLAVAALRHRESNDALLEALRGK